ncbi:hypothetical protein [Sphingobium yanoikuyae]|uniref:hypothetical protein n=1 Tax=Sphingobium yanoikuyae TaxID=13690 RepID=UPI0035B0EEF2
MLKMSTVSRRRMALGTLLGDLLKLKASGHIGSHGTARDDFSLPVHGFAFSVFRDVKDAMVAAGLLVFKAGRMNLHTGGDFKGGEKVYKINGGWNARFKLTDEAIANIQGAGIALDAWSDHWRRAPRLAPELLPTAPSSGLIGLSASNKWKGGGKRKGNALPISEDEPGVREMVADLEAHNVFMRTLEIDGIDFVGLRRLFNEGELVDRRWRSGGRFYSIVTNGIGTRYENMSAEDRVRDIKIGGNPVVEVDMSASQLRLLYALQDTPLPVGLGEKPYALPGHSEEERGAVKLVVAQALGKGKGRSKAWGKVAEKGYRRRTGGRSLAQDFDFARYQEATLQAHPILETLGEPDVPASLQLQFVESEVIRRAMADLREQGIGSLPVHDSLIVPVDCQEKAERALKDAFKAQVGLVLGYSTKHYARVDRKAA